MRIILTIAILGMLGCSKPAATPGNDNSTKAATTAYTGQPLKDDRILCENKPYSDEDLHQAALDVIFPKVRYFGSAVPPLESLRREEAKLKALETWAASITNEKIRDQYLFWVASYSKDYEDLEDAIAHPAVNTKEQDDERERQEKAARIAALTRCLPKPTRLQ